MKKGFVFSLDALFTVTILIGALGVYAMINHSSNNDELFFSDTVMKAQDDYLMAIYDNNGVSETCVNTDRCFCINVDHNNVLRCSGE